MTETKRRQKSQACRTLILDDAIRMLGEHGFNGLTLQALAERCEISNAGLLYYFRSKDELLLAVLGEFELREREVMTPLVEKFEACREDPERAWPMIVELLHQMVMRFAERSDMARLLFVAQVEALDGTHVEHGWFREGERLTLELFQWLLEGFVADPAATSRYPISATHGLGQRWLRQDMGFGLVEKWRKFSTLILPPRPEEAPVEFK